MTPEMGFAALVSCWAIYRLDGVMRAYVLKLKADALYVARMARRLEP